MLSDQTVESVWGLELVSETVISTSTLTVRQADGRRGVRASTNTTGSQVSSATFDVFGNVLSQSGTQSRFAFGGAQRDTESGLLYQEGQYRDATTNASLTAAQDPPPGGCDMLSDPEACTKLCDSDEFCWPGDDDNPPKYSCSEFNEACTNQKPLPKWGLVPPGSVSSAMYIPTDPDPGGQGSGTTDCSYYTDRCREIFLNGEARTYYCVAAPAVCYSRRNTLKNMRIRKCLQDLDNSRCAMFRFIGLGMGSAFSACIGTIHVICFAQYGLPD